MTIEDKILFLIKKGIVQQSLIMDILCVDIVTLVIMFENGLINTNKSDVMLTEKGESVIDREMTSYKFTSNNLIAEQLERDEIQNGTIQF